MKTTYVEVMDASVNISNSELKFKIQITQQKTIGNRYELKIALKDKVHPEMYYSYQPRNVVVDEIPTKIKAQELQIIKWTLTENQWLIKFNLGIDVEPQLVKINAQLQIGKMLEVEQLGPFMNGIPKRGV